MVKKVKQKPSMFSRFCSKMLVLVIIVLCFLIVLKGNADLKNKFYKMVFQNNINFTKINEVYKKYFGSSLPLKNNESKSEMVSSNKLEYTSKEKYKDGVKLIVKNSYLVPSLDAGLIISKGEKKDYGNTVVVQRSDGVEVWYSNLKNISVGLYDYIKKGDYLGEANGDYIYLVFEKEGKTLDYQKYI